jgi:hypothetical protein
MIIPTGEQLNYQAVLPGFVVVVMTDVVIVDSSAKGTLVGGELCNSKLTRKPSEQTKGNGT